MEASARITESVVRKSIAGQLGIPVSDVHVREFSVSAGSKVGDNIICELQAVSAKAWIGQDKEDNGDKEDKCFEFMAKVVPIDEGRARYIRQTDLFESECQVYSKILPVLHQLNARAENAPLALAKSYFVSLEDEVLVMENLKKAGFKMIERSAGLTMAEIRLFLDRLAQYHAVTYKYLQTYPGGLRELDKEFPFLDKNIWMDWGPNSQQQVKEYDAMHVMFYHVWTTILGEECGKEASDIFERAKKLKPMRRQKFDEAQNCSDDPFICLRHGDPWFNNSIFRYDSSRHPVDIRMLDLQMVYRASPAVDLAYFFGTSTSPAFRKEHLSKLLTFYHGSLLRYLHSYGYPGSVYPESQLLKEFQRTFEFGVLVSLPFIWVSFVTNEEVAACGIMLDDDKDAKDENSSGREKTALKQCKSYPEIVKRFVDLGKEAKERGYI